MPMPQITTENLYTILGLKEAALQVALSYINQLETRLAGLEQKDAVAAASPQA